MAPATRRSSGLTSNGNGVSNLDHILEHFNQFKRKHITQNRDIIKTNALAQLRIKELEEKVLQLEAERAEHNRCLINARRRMENAEKSALCMRQGWQMIGAGIAALSSIEGFKMLASEEVNQEQHQAAYASSALQRAFEQASQRPSARISLDSSVLPGGVVRSVARPPEADLENVMEEHASELTIHYGNEEHCRTQDTTMDACERTAGESAEHEIDDNDSEHEDGDPVSFSAADEEDTIRITQPQVETIPQPVGMQQRPAAESFLFPPSNGNPRKLHHAASIDSLSSFADDEEIELSTDDERGSIASSRSAYAPPKQSQPLRHTPHPTDGNGRRRKTPDNSPQHARRQSSRSASSTPSRDYPQSDADDLSASEDARPSRRASMRDRKSINYALPKLNTKMRKPDPVDMIPAAKGEQRRHTNASERGSASECEEHEGGEDRETMTVHEAATAEQTSPRRRTLKGKHEVASTGNLREIRRLHEEQHKQQNGASLRDGGEDGGVARDEAEASEGECNSRNTSPRRKFGSNKSKRKSFSNAERTAEETGNKVEEGTEDSDADGRRRRLEEVELGDVAGEEKTSGREEFDHSLSSIFATSLGTPIPKPVIRPNQQGNIKALKVAGRLQKSAMAPGSQISTLRQTYKPLNQTQPKAYAAQPFVATNAKIASFTGPTRVSATNRPFVPKGRSVSANSNIDVTVREEATPLVSSPSLGDPAKRHSLHAAMTSPNLGELDIR